MESILKNCIRLEKNILAKLPTWLSMHALGLLSLETLDDDIEEVDVVAGDGDGCPDTTGGNVSQECFPSP